VGDFHQCRSIVITPLNAGQHAAAFSRALSGLAHHRRTDMLDLEELVEHLNTIGYAQWMLWRCRGNTPCAAACWMHILLKLIGRCA